MIVDARCPPVTENAEDQPPTQIGSFLCHLSELLEPGLGCFVHIFQTKQPLQMITDPSVIFHTEAQPCDGENDQEVAPMGTDTVTTIETVDDSEPNHDDDRVDINFIDDINIDVEESPATNTASTSSVIEACLSQDANAPSHQKRPEGSLSARHMPKFTPKPGSNWGIEVTHRDVNGKPIYLPNGSLEKVKVCMSDGTLPDGTLQPLYFPEGHDMLEYSRGWQRYSRNRELKMFRNCVLNANLSSVVLLPWTVAAIASCSISRTLRMLTQFLKQHAMPMDSKLFFYRSFTVNLIS
jgi:hypothetical protein